VLLIVSSIIIGFLIYCYLNKKTKKCEQPIEKCNKTIRKKTTITKKGDVVYLNNRRK